MIAPADMFPNKRQRFGETRTTRTRLGPLTTVSASASGLDRDLGLDLDLGRGRGLGRVCIVARDGVATRTVG